jgi:DHA2 family multidrug resistance protein
VALMATILSKRQVFHYDRLVENISPFNPVAQNYLQQIQGGMVSKGMDPTTAQHAAIAAVNGMTHIQALILSFGDIYILVAWLFLFSIPLVFFLGKGAKSKRPGRPEQDS